MNEVLRPRDFGELFSQILSVTFGNIRKLLAIQLVFWIPVYIIICIVAVAVVGAMGFGEGGSGEDVAVIFAFIVFMVILLVLVLLSPLPAAASILAISDRFIGQETSIRDCYALAFRRLLPLIGLMFTLGLILGLAALACLIPYFIVAPRLFIATQCLILEDMGIGAAINRSWSLTQGFFWKIFGLVICIGVFGTVLGKIVEIPQNMMLESIESVPIALMIILGTQIFISMFSAILSAVAAVVVYFDLRTRKEALDMEGLLNLVDEIGPGYEKEGEPT